MSNEFIYQSSAAQYAALDFVDSLVIDSIADIVHHEQLAQAMLTLTGEQLQMLALVYWQKYTQVEIATMLNCSQSCVSKRLHSASSEQQRARRQMRTIMILLPCRRHCLGQPAPRDKGERSSLYVADDVYG